MNGVILAIDQSTSGTKALLFDQLGALLCSETVPHRQIITPEGWVEHDAGEIYKNTLLAVKNVIRASGLEAKQVVCIGISNQRETVLQWRRDSGNPLHHAIVWQCGRAEKQCLHRTSTADDVQKKTGLPLSPYFSAAKAAWLLENIAACQSAAKNETLCCGTIDSWLIWKLTKGKTFATDVSNAARTQLFNIHKLDWDDELCRLFGIPLSALPQVLDSNACFGHTDFDGLLPQPVPIQSVLGDSNGALFGQGCSQPGDTKATYGTGSSVMANIGGTPLLSQHGLATSLAWQVDGKAAYVLEGNINYSGAVIQWACEDAKLLNSPKEAGSFATQANPQDATYLVPAFSGLGAPHWNADARAAFFGMSRTTGQKELVKAAEECIGYQITDVLNLLREDYPSAAKQLSVDGGPTRDAYLMQFQSDIANIPVLVPSIKELSGTGAAYLAGITLGFYPENVSARIHKNIYRPFMAEAERGRRYAGWQNAVQAVLSAANHNQK